MIGSDVQISDSAFRVLAQTAADAVVIIDAESVIQFANPATERIFGYDTGELLGAKLTKLMPERMRAGHQSGVERNVRTGEKQIPWRSLQLPGLRKDGTEFPVEISFGESRTGDVHLFAGFIRDISERVQYERALEHTAAELEATIRELRGRAQEAEAANRTKAVFLATMSHELRTPLNATTGYADLLLEGIPEPIPASARKQVGRIRLASQHLLTLIEEILTHSRVEAGRESVHIEAVQLEDLVREVCAVIQPLAAEKQLEFRGPGTGLSLTLWTDAGKLRQILVNLLGNAVKFTERGWVSLDIMAEGDGVQFLVRDTGIGIPSEDLERIWEPFRQLDSSNTRRAGGTGLGLSVSRQLARLLGGDITVESAPGDGSTFTLRLPLRSEG